MIRFRLLYFCSLLLLIGESSWSQSPGSGAAAITHESVSVAVAFILSTLILKITAFVLGFLIVRLGHDTMIRGVTGDVDFGFSGKGLKLKLKSAVPGTLYVVAGAAIICWGLFVDKPFSFSAQVPVTQEIGDELDQIELPE